MLTNAWAHAKAQACRKQGMQLPTFYLTTFWI